MPSGNSEYGWFLRLLKSKKRGLFMTLLILPESLYTV